jgi:hypothetical protein
MMVPYAAANFTISTGVRLSPGFPPIVPLIPEMLFINDKAIILRGQKYNSEI